jgi:hypothetical protein
MLLYFIDEGVKYKPDVVVLGFISIDMDRNIVDFRDYAKPRFVMRGGDLVLTRVPVPRPEEILEAERYRLRTWDFLKVVGSLFYWRLGLASREKQKVTSALLDELIRNVQEVGAEPVLAYMPTPHEYRRREPTSGEEFFTAYVVDRRVRHLNLRPHFERAMDEGAHFGTGHWNVSGHRLVAQQLAESLRR